ncbi:MAG: hypothetical protein LBH00_12345 [Planctomycetaceae bacterium]|jgi:ADP-dependent phosphofructokinase/glucokinase|nr:hypothetical protein [Planctomycetaceae bacterium]
MERTPYQKKIIERYYDHKKTIMSQKLGELTTELYLADENKRQPIWKRVAAALAQLGVNEVSIEQLVNMNNPSKLAEFIQKNRLS